LLRVVSLPTTRFRNILVPPGRFDRELTVERRRFDSDESGDKEQ
jgi:hypothetical protein